MILRGENEKDDRVSAGHRATLDELFRRAGVRSSSALALIDPPNRETCITGAPRQLTFAQTDRAISALAARLGGLGLQTDSIVAVQLANTVENIITLMAILRAGMIAMPLPLMWRRHELTSALRQIGAKAVITASRIGAVAHADIAVEVAADVFPIRYICAFGENLPDGVMPLDDIFSADQPASVPRPAHAAGDHPADHVAIITLDVTPTGLIPVARSHMQLLAGGATVFLEAGAPQNARILSAIPPSSFAGIALTILPWLTGGGTLSLHHGFEPGTFATQTTEQDVIVLPGAAVTPLAQSGLLAGKAKTILALWRSPEQLVMAPAWRAAPTLVDVASFGEIALLAARRGSDHLPADIPHGRVRAPRANGTIAVAETARSKQGTLLVRGAMVPVHAFPPGVERVSAPFLSADEAGFVDTGCTCRLDTPAQTLVVTGPPGGIATIGGYRFRAADLEAQVAAVDQTATLVALPGGLLAQKLAGSAFDNAAVAAQLLENGVNPLIAGAFRPRKAQAA
ncbi:MAG TPA: class I adenylate-forming enzyme family protein [Pseudolabrys sp.]|nr:class I adenylate-forming enzyme family protein [Pseudolabrys sp.]